MKISLSHGSAMRRFWSKYPGLLSFSVLGFFLVFFPVQANAFKVETHVWVGQQVLNDLEDGKVTISIGGVNYEYRVDPQLVNALRQNADIYRMGNVGTDGLPDMLAAQLVVHPGIVGAWQTDDWLKWIYEGAVTPQQKAFAYGYLAHAATDVFSHTYVNEYSGDIFLLTDGEIENEERHFALEKYIAARTPPLTDAYGNEIGRPYEVLNTPVSFIRDRLILNNTVADQYEKGIATHLSAVQNLQERLGSTSSSLEAMDVWLAQQIARYLLGIKLNEEQAAKIYELAQKINDLLNNNSGIDQLQSATNDLVDYLVKGAGINTDLMNRMDAALYDIASISARLDAKALELAQNRDAYNAAFYACFIPASINCKIFLACDILPTSDARNDCRNWCDSRAFSDCNNALQDMLSLLNQLIAAKQAIEGELLQAHQTLRGLVDLATQTALATIQAQNDILNGLIDSGQRMTSDVNIIRAQIDGWRTDIVNGMGAYVLANAEVLKESMKEGGHMLQPLEDWFDCWGMAITMALPAPMNQAVCSAQNRMDNITSAINDFEALLSSFDPVIKEWNALKDKITQEIESAAQDAANKLVLKVTGIDVQQIVDLFKNPVNAAALNALFSVDRSGKGLPLIPDIAQRVDAEMHLAPNGYFDPDQYAAAYDSVVFAKLSLLGAEQLNQLAWDAGVMLPTMYGDRLYPGDGINSENILFGVIRSIDGNHQWMQVAPPYPRQNGYHDLGWPLSREYGYAFAASEDGYTGLRIWQYPSARDNVFRRMFHGPLVPGIEVPESINFNPIRWLYFPYPVCLANPFPLSIYDQTCRIANVPVSLPPQAVNALTSPPGNSQEALSNAPGQAIRAIKRQHGPGVGKRNNRRRL